MRKLISILLLIVFTSGLVYGVRPHNKMYRVLHKDTELLSAPTISAGGKELMTLHRGDTLLASEELAQYMEEMEGERLHTIPLIFNGQKGYVYYDAIEPVKATPEDTIYSQRQDTPSSETELERSLYSYQDWAMNNTPVEPYSWLWVIIGTLVFSAICCFGTSGSSNPTYAKVGLILGSLSLIVASVAEVMHMLTLTDITWFFSPKIVGWWKAIFNFLLFGITCGLQCVLFIAICGRMTKTNKKPSKKNDEEEDIVIVGIDDDEDDYSEKDWSMYMSLAPFILLLVIFVMFIIDAFSGGEWGLKVYAYVGSVLLIPMAVLEIMIIKNKNFVEALIFPFFYLIGGVAIILIGCVLGLWILVLAVLLIVAGIALAAAGAALGAIFGGEQMTGTLPDGTTVKGYKGLDGKFHANNGQTYTFK